MFRIGLKFPCNGLNRVCKVKKQEYSRLLLTARYYDTRARAKPLPEPWFCKDVKLTSRVPGCKFSTAAPKSEKSGGGGIKTLVALSTVTIGTIGVLSYVRNNPEMRATLEGWIPGTDKTIQIIFQEEASYLELLGALFELIKQTLLDMIFPEPSHKQPGQKTLDCKNLEDYIPPKPAFEPLVNKKDPPINEPYAEIRLSEDKGEKIEVVAEKPAPPTKYIPEELMPANLVELEKYCGEVASKAIDAYQQATCAIQDYNQHVVQIVEGIGNSSVNGNVREKIKEITEKRKSAMQQAEEFVNDAHNTLKRMYESIDDPRIDAPAHMKTAARRNVRKILDDIDDAKKKYINEVESGVITDRYWQKIKAARKYFQEELQILFPNMNVQDKRLDVSEDAFNLFVLHMYHKVNNIQKELLRLETITKNRLENALRSSGEGADQQKLNELVCLEVSKEKRILQEELEKKLLEEKRKFNEELRHQLKLQAEIHADHMKEALLQKERETERSVQHALSEQNEAQSIIYKTQLASIVGRLRGVEATLKARLEEEKNASNAQILWSACQALARAVKTAPPGSTDAATVRPLEPEIQAVAKAAPKEDPLVLAAIQGIPKEASKRGVFPEDTLRERFLKVENVARRLALVPEQGASLPIYFLSYLQSFLLIKTANPIPKSELADEPINVEKLNTFDILQRARYWLDRGNFKMTLRYMNLLKGAPRSIAYDWMNEVRILLETQQAVDMLLAYAGATGLVLLGEGDSDKQQEK